MFVFFTAPLRVPVSTECGWRMIGSDVKLSYAAIPHSIRGYHRLRWPFLILFVPDSSMKRCGSFDVDDYDLLVHVEGEGNLYIEIAVEGGRRMAIPSYAVLARILHALLVQKRYFIANVTYLNLRLVRPRPRRMSLVCFGSDRSADYDVTENLVYLGAAGGPVVGDSSPVCAVRPERT